MNYTIQVQSKGLDDVRYGYDVTVTKGAKKYAYKVTLDNSYMDHLIDGSTTPETFIIASFNFLLAHERPEDILTEFDIMDISRFFPTYAEEINTLIRKGRRPL